MPSAHWAKQTQCVHWTCWLGTLDPFYWAQWTRLPNSFLWIWWSLSIGHTELNGHIIPNGHIEFNGLMRPNEHRSDFGPSSNESIESNNMSCFNWQIVKITLFHKVYFPLYVYKSIICPVGSSRQAQPREGVQKVYTKRNKILPVVR